MFYYVLLRKRYYKRGILGFLRLAIMGLTPEGMQPFWLDAEYACVIYDGIVLKNYGDSGK